MHCTSNNTCCLVLHNLIIRGGEYSIDSNRCTGCGACTIACPSNARTVFGREISAKEVYQEVVKDEMFYDESGGGVTFSGGEPLAQINFLEECLRLCYSRRLHICLDTSGYAPQEHVERVLRYVSLFLYDVKIINREKHRRYTGVDNSIILKNLQVINDSNRPVWARIPIIPSINDDKENLIATAELLSSFKNIKQVNLLPLHKTAAGKYSGLSKNYEILDYPVPDDNLMSKCRKIFEKSGLKVYIGG